MKRLISLLMLCIFTLSLAMPACAANPSTGNQRQKPSVNQEMNQPGGGPDMKGNRFADQLSALVTAGSITQAQADAVETALKPSQSEKPDTTSASANDPAALMKSKLDALLSAGTISSDQETAILNAIQPPAGNGPAQNSSGQKRGNPMENALNSLVTAGTITQDIADTVLEALKSADSNSQTDKSDMKTSLENKLAALVAAGTITQEQSGAILKALQAPVEKSTNNGHGKNMRLKIGSSKMTTGSEEQDIDPGYATAPVINNGTTFVPIRAIVELWGGSINWDNTARTITISLNGNTVVLTIGSTTATVNGETATLSSAPYVSATGRTMVPIRFLAEKLDLTVNWDQTTQSIDIQ